MTAKLPGARADLIPGQGPMAPEYYRYFAGLERQQGDNASTSDIAAIDAQLATLQAEIDALPKSSGYPTLRITYPLLSQGLLQNGFAKLALNQPGDSGTGILLAFVKDAWGRITGTKAATITGTPGRVTVANGDASAGLPTIDLAAVADTGGGSLLRFVRDAWGRITGTSTPSTTDLAEGSNLYFTAARVLTTVLAGLSTATNAAITAADSVLSALGKLQAQISANVMAIAGKLAKSANLSDVANTAASLSNLGGLPNSGGTVTGDITLAGTNTSLRTDKNAYSQITFADGVYGMRLASAGSLALFCAGAASYSLLLSGTSCISQATWVPFADNTLAFGNASGRWSVIYAATGTINTSDAREKTDAAPLTDAELAASADLSRAIGTYRWLASIADKGADKARHHAGLTVQNAIAIMQAHGLDAFRYGFICYDKWDATPEIWHDEPEKRAENGDLVREEYRILAQPARTAGDRYSFRTDELNLFLARGFAARLDALEKAGATP